MARRQRSSSTGHLNLNSRAGGAAGTFLITLLLVVAIGVFAYSGWRLFSYYMAYKQGSERRREPSRVRLWQMSRHWRIL